MYMYVNIAICTGLHYSGLSEAGLRLNPVSVPNLNSDNL